MSETLAPPPSKAQCVLMFHGIGPIPDWIEADERPYWIGWDLFEAITDYVSSDPKLARGVIFTFDDGNASDYRAAQMLAEAGLAGKFFVLAGRTGTQGYLSGEQMREMIKMGMEIGLHGRDHRNWRQLPVGTLEDELVAARAEIAETSGAVIGSVAIPFGAYNRTVMQRLQADNFSRIYTSDPGLARPDARIVRRNTVKGEHELRDIIAMIADQVPIKARLRRAVAPPIKRLLG